MKKTMTLIGTFIASAILVVTNINNLNAQVIPVPVTPSTQVSATQVTNLPIGSAGELIGYLVDSVNWVEGSLYADRMLNNGNESYFYTNVANPNGVDLGEVYKGIQARVLKLTVYQPENSSAWGHVYFSDQNWNTLFYMNTWFSLSQMSTNVGCTIGGDLMLPEYVPLRIPNATWAEVTETNKDGSVDTHFVNSRNGALMWPTYFVAKTNGTVKVNFWNGQSNWQSAFTLTGKTLQSYTYQLGFQVRIPNLYTFKNESAFLALNIPQIEWVNHPEVSGRLVVGPGEDGWYPIGGIVTDSKSGDFEVVSSFRYRKSGTSIWSDWINVPAGTSSAKVDLDSGVYSIQVRWPTFATDPKPINSNHPYNGYGDGGKG